MKMLHLPTPAMVGKKLVVALMKGKKFFIYLSVHNLAVVNVKHSAISTSNVISLKYVYLCNKFAFPTELGLNPLVPSDCRETFVSILQKVPELGFIFQNKVLRESKHLASIYGFFFTLFL